MGGVHVLVSPDLSLDDALRRAVILTSALIAYRCEENRADVETV
jgi:hypothetical protein